MEYRNLIYLFYIKIMFPIHLAVQNLNLSSFMLFLLILNLEFGIIIIIFFFSSTQFNMSSVSMLLINTNITII